MRVDIVPPFWMMGWFRGALGVAAVAGVLLVHLLRTSALTRRNQRLVDLQDRLRLLTQRLEDAKEEERKRIARELHDDLGPSLTAVIINLQLLGEARTADALARARADSIEQVDRIIQRIRDLSLQLRPPLLDELGLQDALSGYLEAQVARSGVAIQLHGESLPRFQPEVEIAAFRIAQEAVTNVLRHAAATCASVHVGHREGRLSIVVEDDGEGFDLASKLDGASAGKALGLLGIEERARTLRGTSAIDSAPGRGTRVSVSFPAEQRR